MAKYCKQCGILNENPLVKLCREHYFQQQIDNPKPIKFSDIKRTPVKLVGKKRTTRIKDKWSEYKVFVEMWLKSDRLCENCWIHIKFFHSSCFAHKLNKRDHPELRYDKDNIAIVHGIFEVKDEKTGLTYNCHQEFDYKFNKEKKLWKKNI